MADANGEGRLLIAPCLANDYTAIWYTTSAAALPVTPIATNTAPANWRALAFDTLPYPNSSLSTNVDGRIVSVGVRMRYTGTVTSMAGMYFSYVSPDHSTVNESRYDISALLAFYETKIQNVSREEFQQAYCNAMPHERAYKGRREYLDTYGSVATHNPTWLYPWSELVDINQKGPTDAGVILNGTPPILVGVTGAQAGTTFLVEVIEHVEYVGFGASVGLTPSANDAPAAEKIDAAVQNAPTAHNAGGTWSSAVSRALADGAKHAGTKMVNYALVNALKAYSGRRVGSLATIGG